MATAPDPSRGSGLTTFCIVLMIISTLAVVLRVWSRLTQKNQKFWWDDWCAIASLPFTLAFLSIVLLLVSTGLGHHENQIAPKTLLLSFKYQYVQELFYQPAITMPKYSALLFFVRVFGVAEDSRFFRLNIRAAIGLVTIWLLWALFFDIFQCTPVRKAWLPKIPGHCITKAHLFDLGIAGVSVIIDVYIMLLPLPILWRMYTGRKRKMMLMGFFFCAYCVIICSLGRLVASVQLERRDGIDGDLTWHESTFYYWTAAELAISTVSICVPNLTQLFRRTHQHGISALFTRRDYVAGPDIRSKRAPAGSAWVQGSNNDDFLRTTGKDDSIAAFNGDPMSNTEDKSGLSSVSASTHQSEEGSVVAPGQVHLRNDSDVREYGSWAMV